MSARDDLHDRMHGVGYCNPPCGLCVEVADLLDAYAHELAEKVMALRITVPDLKARQLFKDGYDAALMVAALTIDPDKEGQ